MPRRYAILDVFTPQALAGNPLAVVLDSEGLDTDAMQRIAREFNLSETVFVLSEPQRDTPTRIRIFTPAKEMPFAGHPTVGTAVLLASRLRRAGEDAMTLVLEENVGLVPCRIGFDGNAYAEFDVPRVSQRRSALASTGTLAAALGLAPEDIGLAGHEPAIFDAGYPFAFVPVTGRAAIERIAFNTAHWHEAFVKHGTDAVFVYTRECTDEGSAFHARMFSPLHGIPEDPATGSAVAAFSGVVAAFDTPADGQHRYRIEQGYEMGRPSQIELGVTMKNGALASATIGGHTVIVAEGTVSV